MEPLILYFVLFFPAVYAQPFSTGAVTGVIPFSILGELGRTLTYTMPALALLWYIIPERKGFSALKQEKPRIQDLFSFIIGLPALIITGIGISLLVSLFSGYSDMALPPLVEGPANVYGWIVMVFSCLCTGYLEESYFRYYLLTKLEYPVSSTTVKVLLTTVLFSLCHVYEGPWGIANAVIAAVILSLIFIRFRSLHGIALAHGAYNIFVYAMGNYIN